MRRAGVLLPIFSLPGKYGIGCFGKAAYEFADKLHAAGQSYWQILPLGPTSYGDSPYQSYSTFAGNPYLIDLEAFPEEILKRADCEACDFGQDPTRIDYGKLYENRLALLYRAYQVENYIGLEQRYPDFTAFCQENAYWLPDYALFMALKEQHGGAAWYDWPEAALRLHEEAALRPLRETLGDRIRFHMWIQYHFAKQWEKLRAYVNGLGIRLIGDIPIYVALDSADVWGNPSLFCLGEDHRPRLVAGCPPDGFSADGQLWGNPVYDWDAHRAQGYDWWVRRVAHGFALTDFVRIDHFRGFDEYYAVPYRSVTAREGSWQKGPGMALFLTLRERLGALPIIAEDLGYLTDTVRKLLSDSGFPGMKVLEFAFDANGDSDYLPHNWVRNSVAYTGTHDNQTLTAWLEELSEADLAFLRDYLCMQDLPREEWPERLIRTALAGVSETVIIPFADWRGLGSEARINHPATMGTNWQWRMTEEMFDEELIGRMARLARLYRRYGED